MNPYDRRAVRSVWARVMPGRDVFAPGAWPAPPAAGWGGVPPTPPRNPDDNRPPMPPGGRPNPPGPGSWLPPPPPPSPSAVTRLLELSSGYDQLAQRYRAPFLRQMAAQCRRSAETLRARCGIQGTYTPSGTVTLPQQQEREAALRRSLDTLPEACTQLARQLSGESQARSRQLSRMR